MTKKNDNITLLLLATLVFVTAAAVINTTSLVAARTPLAMEPLPMAQSACVRIEHEWNGGVQHYRAEVVDPGEESEYPWDACPNDATSGFAVTAARCVDVKLDFATASPLNGAPPLPRQIRLYVVPADHPDRHGTLGRDAWPVTPALADVGTTNVCLPDGAHRLVIRACGYGPTPFHPASVPQCDGAFLYDLNSDDLGRTLPIYTVRRG